MFIRTYTRTLFNSIFKKNIIVSILKKIVNFYCELRPKPQNQIKFLSDLPIINVKEKKQIFFKSFTGDEIDCK